MITDDQLTTFENGGGSGRHEFALAFAGASFGFLQNFFRFAEWIISPTGDPITRWDAFASLVFVSASVLSLALFIIAKQDKSAIKNLAERIRSRPAESQAAPTPSPGFS